MRFFEFRYALYNVYHQANTIIKLTEWAARYKNHYAPVPGRGFEKNPDKIWRE